MRHLLRHQFVQILSFILLLFAIHLLNLALGGWLNVYGVIPRTFIGLRGILFSPLLHGDWTHLFGNAAPLGVMLCLLALVRGRGLWPTTAALWLLSGFAVWLVGRPGAIQVGASGLIYALAAFLIAAAWFQRDLKSAAAALVVIVVYGGIAWGLMPSGDGISWEGHIAGAVAGVLVATPGEARRKAR